MTTNVYDTKSGVLASDSRISSLQDGFLFFVDDTGYEKIVYDNDIAILFAGDLNDIDPWKNWFADKSIPMPILSDELSMCIVNVSSGDIEDDDDRSLKSSCTFARFAGTGAHYAKRCWTKNEQALMCVQSAYDRDLRSGGLVKYFDRVTKKTNLEEKISLPQIVDVMAEYGGVYMPSSNEKKFLPIAKAIKNSSAINDAFEKVRSGGAASLCAPFLGMKRKRSQEEKDKIYSVLGKYCVSK